MERAKCFGHDSSARAFDMFKNIRRVAQGVIYALMHLAGWPRGPVVGYMTYRENMRAHSSFAEGLGEGRIRGRSTPPNGMRGRWRCSGW
eukprot:12676350-Alexandrium_andersonii.AAC.1